MSQKFEKLKTLLKELFQLDQPDLDFGLYRIMHAKSDEITQFLDKDLLPQVLEAFSEYRTADKADLEKELTKAIEQAKGLGVDPESTEKVKSLRQKITDEAVDIDGLENEVYDHLYSFFRRYYHEGDFLAKRVYKPGVYAIPYEGEEVKLHWANRDQYYIKTSEYLRDYTFKLKPSGAKNPMRVHFKLVDVIEGEHGNVKATNGGHVFILAGKDFVTEEDDELVIRFEYRPATMNDWSEPAKEAATAAAAKKPPTQAALIADAVRRVLGTDDQALLSWITELAKPHVKTNGEQAEYSRLEGHLNRYTARNTFDYFIHKDLGGFLRRELDFYIKNEVMHLDDVESESVPRVEQYLSKIKVIRKIAGKIIEFLDQLEGFQKKLWLKKKFVIETNYCITLDRIPEEFYPEIAANEAQREEWVRLFAINEISDETAGEAAYSEPLTVEFLEGHLILPIDTQHFSADTVHRLLDACHNRNMPTAGTLVHGENEDALRILTRPYAGRIRCIYIDPPFNTGDDGFIYKDSYQHSSWCCLMSERLQLAHTSLAENGCIAISIDQEEAGTLQKLCDEIFGRHNRLSMITVKRGSVTGHKVINPGVVNISEYVLVYAKNRRMWEGNDVFAERERDARYSTFIENRNQHHSKWSFISLLDAFAKNRGLEKRKMREHYGDDFESEITNFVNDNAGAVAQLVTVNRAGVGADFLKAVEESERRPDEVVLHARESHPDIYLHNGKKIIFYADKLVKVGERLVTAERASDIWTDVLPNDLHNEGGVDLRKGKKPEALVARLLEMGAEEGELTLDFFMGSGTMPAAAHKSGREWIGIESAAYFDDKPLRRMKNVLYGERRGVSRKYAWKGGGCFKYLKLESYEDALNNLAPRRDKAQASLLDSPKAQGDDGLKEQYMLRYMLDVETRGSQSLLNIGGFTDPTAYKLKVKRPGGEESRETNVDLLETFNYLIGLTVQHIAAPQTLSADTERDAEGRLRLKGRLKPDENGPWWFRTVTGTTPDGKRTLVVWRKLTGDPEQDNLVLDEWFMKQGYSTKDYEFHLIYVNGDNNLENLRQPEDTWKVRLIEEDFHRLMFDIEGL